MPYNNHSSKSCRPSPGSPFAGMESSCGVVALVERLGHSSRVLTESDRWLLPRVVAAISHLIEQKWERLIVLAGTTAAPVLCCYMSDGWGCNIKDYKTIHCADASLGRSVGRLRAEFMAEKVLLKSRDESGRIHTVYKCMPPLALQAKSGWDVFALSAEQPFLRLALSGNILVSVHVQDGQHAAGQLKKQRADMNCFTIYSPILIHPKISA